MSLADLYSALADPTRLRVLELLHDKARPVHELAAAFDISRPAISRHLRVLKEAGLVQEEKQGRENLYSFQRDELKRGIAWLEAHQKKPAKARKAGAVGSITVATLAPVQVEVPAIVAEPTAEPVVAAPLAMQQPTAIASEPVPQSTVAASEPVPEPIIVKPKAPPRPRAVKPKVATEPSAPPPPRETPQLSFFDL